MSGANGSMQGSNYTQALKDAGLRSPQELIKVCEFNPMGGGRIVRDKLWFYLTLSRVVAPRTRSPGCSSTGTPAIRRSGSSTSTPARPAFNDNIEWNAIGRITWQVSPRNKFSSEPLPAVQQAEQPRAVARPRERRKRRA